MTYYILLNLLTGNFIESALVGNKGTIVFPTYAQAKTLRDAKANVNNLTKEQF